MVLSDVLVHPENQNRIWALFYYQGCCDEGVCVE
jgi:hypothetical protein